MIARIALLNEITVKVEDVDFEELILLLKPVDNKFKITKFIDVMESINGKSITKFEGNNVYMTIEAHNVLNTIQELGYYCES